MNTILRAVMFLCFASCVAVTSYGQAIDRKPLDAAVDKALAGYNAGDSKAFFADYAKMAAAIATQATFDAMYKGIYFQTYGKYVSRVPIKEETVLEGDFPLVVYLAEFEKAKKVKVSVNFTKEDGAFKLMQIQFAGL